MHPGRGISRLRAAAGFEALRAGIVADFGLDGQAALVSDGAVASLYHVCHTLLAPGDEFVTTDPTWNWPMAFARSVGATVRQIPIYGPEHGYRLDPARLEAAMGPRTKVVYLVDPNNPLGTACTAEEIAAIVEIVRKAGPTSSTTAPTGTSRTSTTWRRSSIRSARSRSTASRSGSASPA